MHFDDGVGEAVGRSGVSTEQFGRFATQMPPLFRVRKPVARIPASIGIDMAAPEFAVRSVPIAEENRSLARRELPHDVANPLQCKILWHTARRPIEGELD